VELDHVEKRVLLDPLVRARVREQHEFAWVKQDLQLGQRLRLQLGLRGDVFHFEVGDQLGSAPSNRLGASVSRTRSLVSPKSNLAFALSSSTTIFANYGWGFHSNDARDVILGGSKAPVLPRAFAAEVGSRHSWSGGTIAAALWGIDLQSELLWKGDQGGTQASGRTRRVGFDLEGRVRLTRWLWADADLNLARGRFGDRPPGADFIPLAPPVTSTSGLRVRALGGGRLSGGIRYRHVAGRPADENNRVRAHGYTLAELFATWRASRFAAVVTVDNLFNVNWNEAQFATTSRLPGEPNGGVTELNFTPGARRAIQLGVSYRF